VGVTGFLKLEVSCLTDASEMPFRS